ncbi:MAG: hypothetical protein SFU83_02495 [Meiothermus sp.]|nr:hypothetical protein [Meiothermus sp.]
MKSKDLLEISDLTRGEIEHIWSLVDRPIPKLEGRAAWSFEGNGVRTRTSFIAAFGQLGLEYIELPNLLKTQERVRDLAGYLDPFYLVYVIRESDHQRLTEFARASTRPVVNAMTGQGHPCEVLSDAYSLRSMFGDLHGVTIGLWGPTTNVFRSWHQLAAVMGLNVRHFCPAEFHLDLEYVTFCPEPGAPVDVLITDSWPADFDDSRWSLSLEVMRTLGNPKLLPTPPFFVGKELAFDPVPSGHFVGYLQKQQLLEVHRAVLVYLLEGASGED